MNNENYLVSGEGFIARFTYRDAYKTAYTNVYDLDNVENLSLDDVRDIINVIATKHGTYRLLSEMHMDVIPSETDNFEYDEEELSDISSRKFLTEHTYLDVGHVIYLFEDMHLMVANRYFSASKRNSIKLYADQTVSIGIIKEITNLICQKSKGNTSLIPEEKKNAAFYMIVKGTEGYETSQFRYDYKKFNNLEIDSHYNDDFLPVNEKVIRHVNEKKSSGIVILHGVPGTGKTTYLRYLISKCKKDIIYLPPDMTNYLSDPGFIGFMKQQTNCVFIVEDAEEILRKRGETRNSGAVSNILNVSDGILADVLHFNFIFTINSEIDEIDPALRRPGRLIAEYKFAQLTRDKSINLIEQLYPNAPDSIFEAVPRNGHTLAEIYNLNETVFRYTPKKHGIGFTADL